MDISSPTPSDQQYALKWNDFQSSILSSFRHLRDEEDFVDVTLACDQRSFTAHKVVLSACSPYFRKLLKANPCEHPIVILRDIRSEDVENLLRFMYNGEVHIGQEQLSDFLKTAHLLQIRGLAEVTNSHQSLHKSNLSHNASINPASILPALTASLSKEMRNSPVSRIDDSSQPTPPPQKRIKSAELYKKQHGLTDDQLLVRDSLQTRVQQHALRRERDKSKDSHDRDRSLEMKESLLSQALEGGPTLTIPNQHADLQSLQAQSTGEDSNSSDTVASDAGDMHDGLNGSLDHSRTPTFANSFLGLPGLLPGPSGMGDNFDAQHSLLCDAVIKQEINDDDEENVNENLHNNDDSNSNITNTNVHNPSPKRNSNNTDVVSHESAVGLSTTIAALQQQSNHFRQQQEEIVNRLHKAVSDNLKLINQSTESGVNGSSTFISNKQQQQQQDDCVNHNLSLNMNLSANSRFAVRNFNGNASEMKMCRLNKSKLSNSIVGAQQHQQQLHANIVTNDLFSSLIDNNNDDNNNSSSDLIMNDDGNVDGNYLLPCPLCEIPLEPRVFRQHLDRHYPRDSPICPVLQCGRRFAHPNSVRNHMRLKHTVQWNRMKSMRSSGGPFSSLPY
ncbi:hypothetical protein PVAND_012941 [Polypedilum vanderplanki]|uniref:Uncharacterized protein n=1 Tax=Polypedilum vanderplanki TaxID=319348 RepID=A0A9J6CPY8_POLVA|nr:hypothetical protein PVAND_012941 [Polypedilum vanderplanki]